jgi:hypothetical protein
MVEVFEFPIRDELFTEIRNRAQLNRLLDEEALHLRLPKQYFRTCQQKNIYIYARCRQCRACLKYIQKGEVF